MISLREVNKDNFFDVIGLNANNKFVAPNVQSIAEAYFSRSAWFRAIYVDNQPVGFVMLSEDTKTNEYEIWRFMIDNEHQRKGYGTQALLLIINHVKTLPRATALYTSVVEGDGSPKVFYEKFGFKHTGEYEEGEAVMKLPLQ